MLTKLGCYKLGLGPLDLLVPEPTRSLRLTFSTSASSYTASRLGYFQSGDAAKSHRRGIYGNATGSRHRYVARGERMRNQLELIVSELRRVGHDGAVAERMLHGTQALLTKMHKDVARLGGAAALEE